MFEEEPTTSEAKSIGELAQALVGEDRAADAAGSAARAWHAANGEFEHRHTVGVFLKEDEKGNPPTLFVYLDSNGIIQDFSANKDIYIARLANQEFYVSDIRFLLSKYRKRGALEDEGEMIPRGTGIGVDYVAHDMTEGVELSQAEMDEIAKSVESLPDAIRQKAYEARIASAKANKGSGSQKS